MIKLKDFISPFDLYLVRFVLIEIEYFQTERVSHEYTGDF